MHLDYNTGSLRQLLHQNLATVVHVCQVSDLGCVPRGRGLPIFSHAKDWADFDDILFPYWSFINTQQSTNMYKIVPWKDKVETAVWRGSTTGGVFSEQGVLKRLGTWRDIARARLVAQCNNITSKDSPDVPLCDAHFTGYVQLSDGEEAELEKALGGLAPQIPTNEQSR